MLTAAFGSARTATMFNAHNLLLNERIVDEQKKLDAPPPDWDDLVPLGKLSAEQEKMLAHFEKNRSSAPESVSMAHAAIVVLDTPSLSAACEIVGADGHRLARQPLEGAGEGDGHVRLPL